MLMSMHGILRNSKMAPDVLNELINTAIRGALVGLFFSLALSLIYLIYKKLFPFFKAKFLARYTNSAEDNFSHRLIDDNRLWEQAHYEYMNNRDNGLYAKLFALYNGDENKVKSHYLKERVAKLNLNKAAKPTSAHSTPSSNERTSRDSYVPIKRSKQTSSFSKAHFTSLVVFMAGIAGFFFIIMMIYLGTKNIKFGINDKVTPKGSITTTSNFSERVAVIGINFSDNLKVIALLPFKSAACSDIISSFENSFLNKCQGCTISSRRCASVNGFEYYLNNQRTENDYISDGNLRFVFIGDQNPSAARAACYRFIEVNKRGQCIEKL
jgi:hypothetical protein